MIWSFPPSMAALPSLQRKFASSPVRGARPRPTRRRALAVEEMEHRTLLATINEFPVPTTIGGPGGITAGPDGNLWFTEFGASQIGMINPATHAIAEFATATPRSDPEGIAAGPDGNLWFTEAGSNQIGMIDTTIHAVAEFPIPTASAGPKEITVGSDGNLWFTEFNANQIGMINPVTFAIAEFPVPTAGSSPSGIAAGPDGNLWFTELTGNQIGMINTATHAIVEFPVPTANSKPLGITVGPDGNLWFAELTDDKVGMINPTTHAITDFPIPKADVSFTSFITAGPDGNLWFTESQANKIGMINPTTHIINELSIPTAKSSPQRITAGPDGNLWFAEESGKRIGQVQLKIADPVGPLTTTTQLTATPSVTDLGNTITLVAAVTSRAGTPDGTVSFRDGTTILNATPIALDGTGHATFVARALAQGTHAITAVYAGSSRFQTSTSAAQPVTINAARPSPVPTPPEPAERAVARKAKRAVAAVTLAFNLTLDPDSARTPGLYSALGAVKKGRQSIFRKPLGIRTVSFDAGSNTVTLTLAKPFKGAVQVTVHGGLKAASGVSSTRDFARIVK